MGINIDHLIHALDKAGSSISNSDGYVGNLTWYMSQSWHMSAIGHGYYSAVYWHPDHSDRVIKITPASYYGIYGDGYIDFLMWTCRNYPNAGCFPKVYDIHFHEFFTLVDMEALVPIADADQDSKHVNEFLNDFRCGGYGLTSDVNAARRQRVAIADHMHKDLGRAGDCAPRNAMRRLDGAGNETLVLTDPYCYRSAEYHALAEHYIVNGKMDLTVEIYPCSQWDYDAALSRAKLAELRPIASFRK